MPNFDAADLDEFLTHHRQFSSFFSPSGWGHTAWAIANCREGFEAMLVANDRLDLPAIAALAKDFACFVDQAATEAERKQIAGALGGIVRTVMVHNGRRTTGTKRAVPPLLINGDWRRVFKKGEVYA